MAKWKWFRLTRIRDLDPLQGEDAVLELVKRARSSVLQSLDLEQEYRRRRVDAVGEGEDDVAVAEGAAVEVEEGQDRGRGRHALHQVSHVRGLHLRHQRPRAEDRTVEEDVDGVVEAAAGVNHCQLQPSDACFFKTYFRVTMWLGGQ